MSPGREIRLVEEENGRWAAVDEEHDVASHGETRQEALEVLDEVVALHDGDSDQPIADEEAYLRDQGIDPADVSDTRELPEFMK